jgi:hypothetical protein
MLPLILAAYGFTDIVLNMCHGSYGGWQHLRYHSGPTSGCIIAMSQHVPHWMNHQWVNSIHIHSQHGEVVLETLFAGLENYMKMMTKQSGKSSGIYSYLQVTMERVPANLHGPLKMNFTAYSWRFKVFPTGQQFGASQFNCQSLLKGTTGGK